MHGDFIFTIFANYCQRSPCCDYQNSKIELEVVQDISLIPQLVCKNSKAIYRHNLRP